VALALALALASLVSSGLQPPSAPADSLVEPRVALSSPASALKVHLASLVGFGGYMTKSIKGLMSLMSFE